MIRDVLWHTVWRLRGCWDHSKGLLFSTWTNNTSKGWIFARTRVNEVRRATGWSWEVLHSDFQASALPLLIHWKMLGEEGKLLKPNPLLQFTWLKQTRFLIYYSCPYYRSHFHCVCDLKSLGDKSLLHLLGTYLLLLCAPKEPEQKTGYLSCTARSHRSQRPSHFSNDVP